MSSIATPWTKIRTPIKPGKKARKAKVKNQARKRAVLKDGVETPK